MLIFKSRTPKKKHQLILIGTQTCTHKQFKITNPLITDHWNYLHKKHANKNNNTTHLHHLGAPDIDTIYSAILTKKAPLLQHTIAEIAGNLSRLTDVTPEHIHIQFSSKIVQKLSLETCIQAFVLGFQLGRYHYKKRTHCIKKTFTIEGVSKKPLCFSDSLILSTSINHARDLMYQPSNKLTPKAFCQQFKEQFKNEKIQYTIHTQTQLKKMNMNGILSVAKGSAEAPYLIEAHYKGNTKKTIDTFLIGKGVTFDAGGISIKPSRSMANMKADMGGSAVAMGTFESLVKQKSNQNVSLLIPLVENLPSGSALKPGDVIVSKNKQKIEIINTDAEGRLLLADCLAYASEQKPNEIIDIATLTGACSIALGDEASAILGTSPNIQKLIKISNQTGEKLWELPLYDGYLAYLKSDVADIKNAHETRLAGTSTAAIFLKTFVSCPNWIHIDIASTMTCRKTHGYKVKGFQAEGIQNLVQYIKETSS